MTKAERTAVNCAIGRIFRLASRPEQPGDAAEYERCRRVILDLVEAPKDMTICYARDYGKGAQGQW